MIAISFTRDAERGLDFPCWAGDAIFVSLMLIYFVCYHTVVITWRIVGIVTIIIIK